MAGRRPRVPRDEQAGIAPLRGEPPPRPAPPLPPPPENKRWPPPKQIIRPGIGKDWERQENGRGARFPPGNEASVTHGTSPSSERNRLRIERRARQFMSQALADPAMPDHLRSPSFRHAVWGWSKAEVMAEITWEWATGLIEAEGLTAMMLPPLPGTNPVFITVQSAERTAAWHRGRIGLDPVSYARIAKDLGLNRRAQEDGLTRLAGQGAEIVARRRALAAVPDEAAGTGDG